MQKKTLILFGDSIKFSEFLTTHPDFVVLGNDG